MWHWLRGHRGQRSPIGPQAVTYSLRGIDDLLDPPKPFRRLAFLPTGKDPQETLSRHHGQPGVLVHDAEPATDGAFANRYWYVHYVKEPPTVTAAVRSTEQI